MPSAISEQKFITRTGDILTTFRSFQEGLIRKVLPRFEHFKEAIHCPLSAFGNEAANPFIELVTRRITSSAPPGSPKKFCVSKLNAFKKNDSGVRPTAVGDVSRRFSSKVVTR